MKGMSWPVRRMRKKGGSMIVAICPHCSRYLGLEPGDWISFWATCWAGYLLIRKVDEDLRGLNRRAARKRIPIIVTQVVGKSKSLYMVIPKEICDMLGVDVGDLLLFGWTVNEGEFSIAGILGGRNSEGEKDGAQGSDS